MTKKKPASIPTIVLTPSKSAVSQRGCTLDVLVRVQAPDMPTGNAARPKPKRLSLVIDRSGSMHGDPLTEALRCANHIASRMTALDELSVIVYDDQVKTVVPLAPVLSHQDIASRLAEVRSGGNTALFAGWEHGAQSLEGSKGDGMSRVILLSDGQANKGPTEIEEITPHCVRWLLNGVSTTTVGLGRGFNEELMAAMAKGGGGQHYYGQTAADLFDAFDEEFALLAALYVKNLGVRFIPADGVILETVGIFTQRDDGFYKLSDLAYGAEAWMAVRLYIKPSKGLEIRDLFAVAFKAQRLDDQALVPMMEMLSLPVVGQKAFSALTANPLVLRGTMEAEFAKESKKLHLMARAGDLSGLNAVLDELQAKFGDHPWLRDKIAHLRELAQEDVSMAAKESQVLYFRCAARLSDRNEGDYSGDETDREMPAFLRKKVSEGRGRRLTN